MQYLPMPFSERAKPDPIKDTQDKPGTARQKQDNKVGFPQWPDDPREKIKENKQGMENYEKNIKKTK